MTSKPQKILIAGGSGLIGSALAPALQASGHQVAILTRRPEDRSTASYGWDPSREYIEEGAIEWCDTVINLAGAGIADKRWSPKRKAVLRDSRVDSTKLLVKAIMENTNNPTCRLINASAVGYYGSSSDPKTESDVSGQDFMAILCQEWEDALDPLREASPDRWAIARIGVVLTTDGGALGPMLPLIRLGIPHFFGSGNQYWSWIHIDDIVRALIHLVEHQGSGIFNLTAPHPVTQREFGRTLKEVRNMILPCIPVPGWLMRLALGEMSAVVLGGNQILPGALESAGYEFKYAQLSQAMKHLLTKG